MGDPRTLGELADESERRRQATGEGRQAMSHHPLLKEMLRVQSALCLMLAQALDRETELRTMARHVLAALNWDEAFWTGHYPILKDEE